MSLPSNPCGMLTELWPYSQYPYTKFADENRQHECTDPDGRGLKRSLSPRMCERFSSKMPRVMSAERNPRGGVWLQGRQRVHYSCNLVAKPNRPRWAEVQQQALSGQMSARGFAAMWGPYGFIGVATPDPSMAGKAKERSEWHPSPPRARA